MIKRRRAVCLTDGTVAQTLSPSSSAASYAHCTYDVIELVEKQNNIFKKKSLFFIFLSNLKISSKKFQISFMSTKHDSAACHMKEPSGWMINCSTPLSVTPLIGKNWPIEACLWRPWSRPIGKSTGPCRQLCQRLLAALMESLSTLDHSSAKDRSLANESASISVLYPEKSWNQHG